MGYYIEVPVMKNKAEKIKKIFNATEVSWIDALAYAGDDSKAVICVIENANFDAAAFCHSVEEFERFSTPTDTRRRTWLLADDREAIETVTGYRKPKSLADLRKKLENIKTDPSA